MLSFLRDNWFVLTGMAGIIAHAGAERMRLSRACRDIEETEKKDERLRDDITEIKENVAWMAGRMGRSRPTKSGGGRAA